MKYHTIVNGKSRKQKIVEKLSYDFVLNTCCIIISAIKN